jgi:hypothetical protein
MDVRAPLVLEQLPQNMTKQMLRIGGNLPVLYHRQRLLR